MRQATIHKMTCNESLTIRISRGFVLILCLILGVGALYGRRLQYAFPGAVGFIGYVALGLLLFSSYLAIVRGGLNNHPHTVRVVVLAIASYSLCESLIITPIERIHFIKYGLLSLMLYRAIPRSLSLWHPVPLILTMVIGVGEETAQYFIPDRVGDPRDMLLNVVAALIGWSFGTIIFPSQPSPH